jgi:tetratricopeptide (TPR) repeat protein
MKRSRAVAPRLKHLAFFEMLVDVAEETPTHRAAIAGLLTLRLIDHWVLAGAVMVEPESASVRAVREAIMAIAANDPQREVLLGVVNTMQTLREVDMQPVLPRLFAYAGILEKRGMLELAADAYESVIRHGDGEYDGDVVIDSHMRLGFCRRLLGSLPEADEAYAQAGKIAKLRREPARVLHARIGIAKVALERGNLPEADQMLGDIAKQCAQSGFEKIQAMALHDQATVAMKRGDHVRAVCLAYESLERTSGASERERVLNDIAASFAMMGRFPEARTAFLIQEATASSREVRTVARINLMALAAREGDLDAFKSIRGQLAAVTLPPEMHVNFLIESARGVAEFGESQEVTELLQGAINEARSVGLHRSVFEAEDMLRVLPVEANRQARGGIPAVEPDPAAYVVSGLRRMLASLSASQANS